MKLRPLPFGLASSQYNFSRPVTRPIWHAQRSNGIAHSAKDSGKPRRPPHPRQKPLRSGPPSPVRDLGVDPDTALETAIANLRITKPQDAPLLSKYDESSKLPKVAELCARLGLAYPKTKQDGGDPNLAIDFSISTKHCFHDYHMRDVQDPLSPFQDLTLDMAVARHEKEALWLNVLPLKLKTISAVVQSRGVKRMKHALAEALRLKGYSRHGWPMPEKEAEKLGITPAPRALHGTVRVRIGDLKKFCAVPFAQVVAFWGRQIDGRLRAQLGKRQSQAGGALQDSSSDEDGSIRRQQKKGGQGAAHPPRNRDSGARSTGAERPNRNFFRKMNIT